jgi:hypothetical protein
VVSLWVQKRPLHKSPRVIEFPVDMVAHWLVVQIIAEVPQQYIQIQLVFVLANKSKFLYAEMQAIFCFQSINRGL